MAPGKIALTHTKCFRICSVVCQNVETLDSFWSFAVNGGEDEPNAVDLLDISVPVLYQKLLL